jgi:23S rRNA pseudouridine2605 synthase
MVALRAPRSRAPRTLTRSIVLNLPNHRVLSLSKDGLRQAHTAVMPATMVIMTEPGVRLQKVLAAAGIASRRAAEIMISQGRVEVNGKVVVEQGLRIDPERDVVRVDGSRIPPPRRHLYLVLNKPRGVVSTMDDPEGRRTLADLLVGKVPGRRSANDRLFHVGRLDTETEGLLILTNDGDFGHRLAHPSYQVPKTYLAEVEGLVSPHTLKRLRQGVTLDDGPVRPTSVKIVSSTADKTLVRITLTEGRNRIVRRTMEAVGHPVRRLSRTGIGPVRLGNLKVGEFRELTRDELGELLDLTSG